VNVEKLKIAVNDIPSLMNTFLWYNNTTSIEANNAFIVVLWHGKTYLVR